MTYDLLIKGGTVVDGTGRVGRRADVAVVAGEIVGIGKLTGNALHVIDATNRIVAPGFIDVHTHYDAQICWDPSLAPSSWHGITTTLMGNCGVGIAPCRSETREIAMQDLVNVESIPYPVLKAGITWDWESFPEYMGAASRRGSAVNLAFLAPLTPFRHFVMGEESMQRAATREETEAITELLREAVEAGAFGFSTSVLKQHMGYQGRPLACQMASRDELQSYCEMLKEIGKGFIEVALCQKPSVMSDEEYSLLDFLLSKSERRIAWLSAFQRDDLPEAHLDIFERAKDLIRRGALPQISAVPFTREISMRSPFSFASYPCFHVVFNKTDAEQKKIYADASFREEFRQQLSLPAVFNGDWSRIKLVSVVSPTLKVLEGQTVAQIASAREVDGVSAFLDLALEDDLNAEFTFAAYNSNDERMPELLTNMDSIIALSDGGAHVDLMCDAAYPSHLLGKWVREKKVMPLETAIMRLTGQPADLLGIRDRGRIQTGLCADLVIFDADKIRPAVREVRYDLPAGGKRIVVSSEGISFTIVNGTVVYADGKWTGAKAGKVLKSTRS